MAGWTLWRKKGSYCAESAPTTLKKGATVTLGTNSETLTHANYRSKGKPITWKVTKGKDVCSLSTGKKGKVSLTVSKKGSCTVQATASKVKNRYKEYLDRVRAKYAALGREARTRTELYAAAQSDGLLEERWQS